MPPLRARMPIAEERDGRRRWRWGGHFFCGEGLMGWMRDSRGEGDITKHTPHQCLRGEVRDVGAWSMYLIWRNFSIH